MGFQPSFSCVLWAVITQIYFAQFIKDRVRERRRSLSKQSTNHTDGGIGGGEGARYVLHPGLSVGLMADAFCVLV